MTIAQGYECIHILVLKTDFNLKSINLEITEYHAHYLQTTFNLVVIKIIN